MTVTRDDLRRYKHMIDELKSLDAMIESVNNTYKSPQLTSTGASRPRDPSDPVSRALYKKDKLRQQRMELMKEMIRIEQFVDSIDDMKERAICRYHYLMCFTWEDTCFRLQQYSSAKAVSDYDRRWWNERP